MPRIVSEIVDVYPFRRLPQRIEFLQLQRADGEVLGGTWQAVHGRIEPGERAWQAALRELAEETGLTPRRLWQVDAVNTFYEARSDCVHLCPCFAAETDPAATIRLCGEHRAWRWLPMLREMPAAGPASAGVEAHGVESAAAGLPDPRWRLSRRALREFMWPGQRRAIREIVAAILRGSAAEPHLRIPTSGAAPE